ncbi:hypothetical protein [Oleiharenicola lentus]|uniref:hypothetical protein n=1 Tax=Oleiharenicola lentus TaxID=2508720 RepID=UPI003F662D16
MVNSHRFLFRVALAGLFALLAACSNPTVATSATANPAAPARPAVGPHDAFVLLSGGGSPLSNQYSQYLQAKAMTAYFQETYPAEAVWTFFGTGAQPDKSAVLADVHRKVKKDGLLLSTWLAGELPRNRPANRAEILAAFKNEILPRVARGGTLYLFVGDHGSLTKDKTKQSAITLWQLQPTKQGGWGPDLTQEITVDDLRELFAKELGGGRVVFCMTQCHSGGFHFVGVPRAITPNPAWLNGQATAQEIAAWRASLGSAPVAGFTATDEPSLAAGCTPNPDPDRWAGYERYIPEFLVGFDLLEQTSAKPRAFSFAAAHDAATLVDRTIDKPYSTSDQYLERWAAWLDTADATKLKPTVARHLAVYREALAGNFTEVKDAAFQEKRAQFARFTQSLIERHSHMEKLLIAGTPEELVAALGPASSAPGRPRGNRAPAGELPALWKNTLRPAWQKAVEAGEITGVSELALNFEKFLLRLEARGSDFTSAGQKQNEDLLTWTYWQSSYAWPTKFDATKADAVTRWSVERRWFIGDWARQSSDPAVRAVGEKWLPQRRPGLPVAPVERAASVDTSINKTAVERVIFCRKVLGAWAFLLAVSDEQALARLQQLIELENTPLPIAVGPR